MGKFQKVVFSMKNKYFIYSISIILFLIIWEIIGKTVNNTTIFPSVFIIIKNIKEIITSPYFYISIKETFIRIIEAFLISLVTAVILGIIAINSKFYYTFISPYMSFIRYAPIIAMIVLILIWFPKETAPVIIGVMISFPIFYDNIINSIKNLNTDLKSLIKVFHINKLNSIIHIYLPTIVFSIINTISSVFGLIIKTVIAGEIYSQPKYGIGSQILYEKMSLNTSAVISWIIIIIFLSFLLDLIFRYIQNRLLFWRYKNEG